MRYPCNRGLKKIRLSQISLPAHGKMKQRRSTVEHVFGTLKFWTGSAHFLMGTPKNVGTEMSLHVLAYNLRRVMNILGIAGMMKAIRMAAA